VPHLFRVRVYLRDYRVPRVYGRLRISTEDPVHDHGTGLDRGPDLLPIHLLGHGRPGVSDKPRDHFQRYAAVGQQGHEAVPELPGRPVVGVDPVNALERLTEGTTNVGRVQRLAHGRGEDEPVFPPEATYTCSSNENR
jgi:hypothetical protein